MSYIVAMELFSGVRKVLPLGFVDPLFKLFDNI